MTVSKPRSKANEPGACEHCGALTYGDTLRCPQCHKFPIKMHRCSHCQCIAAQTAERCWKCGRLFLPDGDYL